MARRPCRPAPATPWLSPASGGGRWQPGPGAPAQPPRRPPQRGSRSRRSPGTRALEVLLASGGPAQRRRPPAAWASPWAVSSPPRLPSAPEAAALPSPRARPPPTAEAGLRRSPARLALCTPSSWPRGPSRSPWPPESVHPSCCASPGRTCPSSRSAPEEGPFGGRATKTAAGVLLASPASPRNL
mmetsp:Transcript_81814/g.252651  ORF Transcript_81814/g.252651 Transcript_81814/m.252651 type:complete len:185 (+) Transcript_81814:709-1263(+)